MVQEMGWDRRSTLLSAHILSLSLMRQEKYQEAEDLARRAYEGRQKLGTEKQKKITGLVLLVCLDRIGKMDEAQKVKDEMGFQKEDAERFWSSLPEIVDE